MDDYKRSLYMMAQNKVRSTEGSKYICIALKDILYREGYKPTIGHKVLEFFPEFSALYDGVLWCEDGISDENFIIENSLWEDGWEEPRIRALDCILRD